MFAPTYSKIAMTEEFWQKVHKEEKRFLKTVEPMKRIRTARRYLDQYGFCDGLLAVFGLTDNSPRYSAAHKVINDTIDGF